ncbi:MAG: hypothetical protein R3211_10590 [Balneolaceae bacterium]|nr:hypothetical protein [Balneolaceae bacterium]
MALSDQERNIELFTLYTFAVGRYRKYFSFVLGIAMTYYVLGILPQVYFLLRAPVDPTLRSQLLSVALSLFQMLLSIGFIKIMLKLVDDRDTGVTDLFNNLSLLLSYLVASFLYSLIVIAGLFLLIVPGIIAAVRLQFFPYYIIERDANAFQALQNSYVSTRNLTFELFLFGLTVLILNVAGVMVFGIGLVLSYPVTTMATAVIYRGLKDEAEQIPTIDYLPE